MKNIFTFLLLLLFLSSCSNDRKSFYLLKEGKAKMRLQDYHGAIQDYNKAIELNPENTEAFFNRGKAKIFLSDYYNAKLYRMVRKVSNYDKNDFTELMEVIQIEIEEAIQDYTKAIELNPENAETYFNRGKAKIFLREFHNTKMYLMVRKPSYYDKMDLLEIKELIIVKTEEAILDFTKAIELDPKYAISHNNRGNAKRLLGDYDRAIQDFTKAVEVNPNYVEAYNNRGRAKMFLKDYNGAIQDFNKAIELNPKYPISYNNRGNSKGLLRDYEGAIQDYSKAIELNPKYVEAYNNRGTAKISLRDYHNGKMYIMDKKAPKYDKKNLIEINEVIKDYTMAISIDPENAEAYFYRGNAKYELNMLNEACLDWSIAGKYGYRDAYDMIRKHTVK